VPVRNAEDETARRRSLLMFFISSWVFEPMPEADSKNLASGDAGGDKP
jgi:hypothetical protein